MNDGRNGAMLPSLVCRDDIEFDEIVLEVVSTEEEVPV